MAQRSEYEKALLARARKLIKQGVITPPKLIFVNDRGFVEYNPYTHPENLHQALKEGATVKEFCRSESISRQTFYQWLKRHPEFKQAFERGREAGKEIWRARCRGETREINPKTGKLFSNYSYHRLLATNIYGREFLR